MAVFTGKNVEEAIETGLNELGIPRLKARIKVISKEKKGFLGFGKKTAQVEVSSIEDAQESDKKASSVTSIFKERPTSTTELDEKALVAESIVSQEVSKSSQPIVSDPEVTDTEIVIEEAVVTPSESADSVESQPSGVSSEAEVRVTEESEWLLIVEEQSSVYKETSDTVAQVSDEETFDQFVVKEFSVDDNASSPELVAESEEAARQVTAYVQNVIDEMDVEASIDTQTSRRRIKLQIETTEPGRVIGYHGKVLKSLQLLAQNYLHDRYSRHYSVSINVHDYVEHRTETLIDFTQKIADRVLESGESFDMDPMSNSERKTVHKTISQIEGVSSYSEGDDPNRYVVVTLSED
ncbi:RNA-binding cell elongation regulator Jag/EloR [Streptococcus pluranimalium]|uniref:RNA-binding cell elongation regulator Jag/EloR n=1 Tax=Streptococcus pluranimalium TaxID=82348 RepID=UPI0039FC3584